LRHLAPSLNLRYLDVELELPLADTESVSSIQVLLLFDYQLTDMVDVHMESAAFFEFTGAGSGSELSVDGPLVFKQLDPLAWNGERYQYNQPVVNSSSYAPADYDFATILQNYENRNGNVVVRRYILQPLSKTGFPGLFRRSRSIIFCGCSPLPQHPMMCLRLERAGMSSCLH